MELVVFVLRLEERIEEHMNRLFVHPRHSASLSEALTWDEALVGLGALRAAQLSLLQAGRKRVEILAEAVNVQVVHLRVVELVVASLGSQRHMLVTFRHVLGRVGVHWLLHGPCWIQDLFIYLVHLY